MLIFLKANIHPGATPLKDAIELAQTNQPCEKKNVWRGWLLFCLLIIGMVSAGIFVVHATSVKVIIFLVALGLSAALFPMLIPTPDMGLGWHIASLDVSDDRILWHNGGSGGYRCYMGFVEGRDVGIVLFELYRGA